MKKFLHVAVVVILFFLCLPVLVFAQEENREVFKGKVIKNEIVSCGDIVQGEGYECIEYEVEILNGSYEGETVSTKPTWVSNEEDVFKTGSKVYISYGQFLEGESVWNIESYSREKSLLALFFVFVSLIIIVGGKKGVTSTLGLIVSFLIIYFFAIPQINNGGNIFLISSVMTFVLLIASTFVTYGLNIKSLVAFLSTFSGILIIAVIGFFIIKIMGISGSGEEASAMLFEGSNGTLRLSSIYLLSIVVGALGVLDDVTVGQVSSMMEIYETDKSLSSKDLYRKSMNIGRDHISSMVNTLFIAYAGSSFSLVMLLSANNPDLRILINTGFIVEEVVRTLVASIGLVLVVPLTSLFASKIVVRVLKN